MRMGVTLARGARRKPVEILALAGAAAYLALIVSIIGGGPTPPGARLIIPLPVVIVVLALLSDVQLPPRAVRATAATGIALAAYVGAQLVPRYPLLIVGLPVAVAAAVFAARRPTVLLLGTVFATGAFGSLDALASVPAAKIADLLLIGLWGAVAWTWAFGRADPLPLVPSLVALGLFIVFSAVEILAADSVQAAVQAFRGQFWYMAAVLLVAIAPWTLATRQRMLKATVAVGVLVGGYATLRWQIGPAGAEARLGAVSGNNYIDGELGVIGSFATRKELAFWTAIFVPFLFGLGLSWRGRWRWLALLGAAACATGMLASDVRAGVAAAAPGAAAVLTLYVLSQAYRGRRGLSALLIVVAAVAVSAGAFTLTLSGKNDTQDRYGNILRPTEDASYQARVFKWRQAVDDIDTAPFGHGLGSAGRAQKRYGADDTLVNDDIDNSYLTIAYQQGAVAMVVLAGILLALLLGLVRTAVTTLDPAVAAPTLAAAGTLAAMLIIFFVGEYFEGLPVLGGWIIVGLGMAELARARQGQVAP